MDVKVLIELTGIAVADPEYIKGPEPVRDIKPKPSKEILEIEKMREQ